MKSSKSRNNLHFQPRDYIWLISILIGVIVLLLIIIFISPADSTIIIDAISIGSGLTSIVLGVVAIIYSIITNANATQKEGNAERILENIVENVNVVNSMIKDLKDLSAHTSEGVQYLVNSLTPQQEEEITSAYNNIDFTEPKPTLKDNKLKQIFESPTIKQGDIVQVYKNATSSYRPYVIVSNNIQNKYSPLLLAIPITSKPPKKKLPFHIEITLPGCVPNAIALCEAVSTIEESQIQYVLGTTPLSELDKIIDSIKLVVSTIS